MSKLLASVEGSKGWVGKSRHRERRAIEGERGSERDGQILMVWLG